MRCKKLQGRGKGLVSDSALIKNHIQITQKLQMDHKKKVYSFLTADEKLLKRKRQE